MAKRTVYHMVHPINGIDVTLRVQRDSEWKEFIAQVCVAGGAWSGGYHTDDMDDAINTGLSMARTKAAQQKIAQITSLNH